MTLDYKILWFEDEETWYEAILPDVSEYLTEKGFTLVPKRKDNGSELDKIFDDDDYDLILMDYNLLGDKGDVIIERIRNLEIYTNIVFYSQDGEKTLRSGIAAKGLDGVYCAHREQGEFLGKVNDVIAITIKKVVDLNNTRGLVMAYTSELDLLIEELINTIIPKINGEESQKQKEIIKSKLVESLEAKLKKINAIDPINNFNELFDIIDSSHKVRGLVRLCKKVDDLKEFVPLLENYQKEILDIRNVLAHVCEEVDDKGRKKLKSNLKGYEEFVFNEAQAIEIRTNIKKYSETLTTIGQRL
ncbi:MAG: hypothetical protein IPM56_17415 [Ignavibacteriales bacterium]|nr:MAG: hypothetical protein IPM56_17415 [Ignavibacteriales bacterium]